MHDSLHQQDCVLLTYRFSLASKTFTSLGSRYANCVCETYKMVSVVDHFNQSILMKRNVTVTILFSIAVGFFG